MMTGIGIPSSHNNAPLPKPMTTSCPMCLEATRATKFGSIEAENRSTTNAIAVSREDPKILRVDDAEIVGDGRRELVEPARHGFAQEPDYGFGEVAEFGV